MADLINISTLYHFILFAITFFILQRFVFQPLYEKQEARRSQTEGQSEKNKELWLEVESLEKDFRERAKNLNAKVAEQVQAQQVVQKEVDLEIKKTKDKVKTFLAQKRKEMEQAEAQARKEFEEKELAGISQALVNKLTN